MHLLLLAIHRARGVPESQRVPAGLKTTLDWPNHQVCSMRRPVPPYSVRWVTATAATRLTNLMQLAVDTSWWPVYRSRTKNPDLGDTFPQAIPGLSSGTMHFQTWPTRWAM